MLGRICRLHAHITRRRFTERTQGFHLVGLAYLIKVLSLWSRRSRTWLEFLKVQLRARVLSIKSSAREIGSSYGPWKEFWKVSHPLTPNLHRRTNVVHIYSKELTGSRLKLKYWYILVVFEIREASPEEAFRQHLKVPPEATFRWSQVPSLRARPGCQETVPTMFSYVRQRKMSVYRVRPGRRQSIDLRNYHFRVELHRYRTRTMKPHGRITLDV